MDKQAKEFKLYHALRSVKNNNRDWSISLGEGERITPVGEEYEKIAKKLYGDYSVIPDDFTFLVEHKLVELRAYLHNSDDCQIPITRLYLTDRGYKLHKYLCVQLYSDKLKNQLEQTLEAYNKEQG